MAGVIAHRGSVANYLDIRKGVFCQVVEPEDMPFDSAGNRADVIMDPNSIINRAIPSVVFEQYINASSRDAYKGVIQMTGVARGTYREVAEMQLKALPIETIDRVYDYVVEYYRIVSKEMYAWWQQGIIDTSYQGKIEYLAELIEKGKDTNQIGKWMPSNHQEMTQDIITNLERSPYCPTYGPVWVRDEHNQLVQTIDNVRIGSCYMILLEKIADDWTAVASAKTQTHNVIAPLTRGDKYTSPVREQGVRGAGEAEVRNFVTNVGPRFVAELLDRNGNPHTHRIMVERLLVDETPSNIDNLVNRRQVPFGNAVPHMLVNHALQVSGVEFAYAKYDSSLRNLSTTGEEDDYVGGDSE